MLSPMVAACRAAAAANEKVSKDTHTTVLVQPETCPACVLGLRAPFLLLFLGDHQVTAAKGGEWRGL